MNNGDTGINTVAMTIEYWPRRGSNQRPFVLFATDRATWAQQGRQ